MTEKREKRGDFTFWNVAGNYVLIFPHPTPFTGSCITMTGSAVKKFIDIPYFHRIIKLVLIHLDASYAKVTTDLAVIIELEQKRSIISPYFTDKLFEETDIQKAEFIENFGEEFEYEPRTWSLSLTAASGEFVIPVLYIQKLGGS